MHFNDLHLFANNFHLTALQGYKFTGLWFYIDIYRYNLGILWDVKTLGSCISKTTYPIAMKFSEVV